MPDPRSQPESSFNKWKVVVPEGDSRESPEEKSLRDFSKGTRTHGDSSPKASQGRPNNPLSEGSRKKQEVVSITYEEIGLFPRSFSRVLDRFLKQVFSDVENLVLREYRFYRYLFLTTVKSLFILLLVPFLVNFLVKTYVVRPLTSYFWNTKQTEIFLNSYQQKQAFTELKDFEEKLYFESLIYPKSGKKMEAPFSSRSVGGESLRDSSHEGVNQVELEGTYFKNREDVPTGNKSEGLTTNERKSSFSVLTGSGSTKGRVPTGQGDASRFANRVATGELTTSGPRPNTTVDIVENEGISIGRSAPLVSSFDSSGLSPFLVTFDEKNPTRQERHLDEKTESLIHSYTLKSSLFVYQTKEADKNIQQRYQEKTIELAQRYNDQSIEAITNFFGDVVSLASLFYLLYALEIQMNITKSFLLEVFFGLDDSKKSLFILLVTDLLVGYHSSNLWELFFSLIFHHYGLPESQTGIFLLVATLPVLLDVLFKYLIFRHLNRSSPATVATYHAMIE